MSNHSRTLVRIVLVLVLTACGLVVVLNRTSAQTPPSASQTAAPAEPTVEQNHKNIQVLKGLPESQLIPVMNFMGASLGVRCNYCHVNNNGTWDYASDEKGEKKSAREMITMVTGINKNSFRGNPEVSCYTCHRGRTAVAHTVSMPLPTPEPRPSPAPSPNASVQQQANPTAEQIIDKYYEAIGGAAAIDKLKSRVMKGTLIANNGNELGYELYQSGPDSVVAVLNAQTGVFERGFDGAEGWEKSARGIRKMADGEVYYLRRYPNLYQDIKLKGQFSRVTFGGKQKIDDRDVYLLRATATNGKREALFFDAVTGLLVRRSTSTTTPVGNIPEQVDFSDYRDVDGMKLPFTIRTSVVDPTYSVVRKFTEIKLNVPIDPKRFNKPT
jgi:photosynthetic reaction center cytochrome c subunit